MRRAGPTRAAIGTTRRRDGVEHPVTTDATQHLHPETLHATLVADPGQVIPGIEHEHRRRPPHHGPGHRQPGHDRRDLCNRDQRRIIVRADATRVEQRGPRRRTPLQARGEGERPARDRLTHPVTATRGIAVTQPRRGHRVRTRPRRHIHRDLHRPRIHRIPRPGDQPRQPIHIDITTGQGVIHRPVPAPESLLLGELHQRVHRTRARQHRINQLEQRIPTPPETLVHTRPKPHQPTATHPRIHRRHRHQPWHDRTHGHPHSSKPQHSEGCRVAAPKPIHHTENCPDDPTIAGAVP